jgi:sialidase-1
MSSLPSSSPSFSVPYASGEGGYDTFRSPAAVTTPAGTLLAFAEARVGGSSDTGDIDVVVRRSTDGGLSWGPIVLVVSGDGDTRGNPAPVVDPASGHLVLVTCFNGGTAEEGEIMRGEVPPEESRRVFVQTSEDDGLSFSAPREITESVKPAGWRWYATGPGHAVALTRGPHAGRLVVAANHSASPAEGSADTGEEDRYYGGHALLSDDGGAHWRTGFVDGEYDGEINANESIAAELPDGRVYFNCRDQNGTIPGGRMDAYSSDGGETLDAPYAPQPTLADVPVVQSSVLSVGGTVFFSGPSNPEAREAMAVWRSDDAGRTYRKVATLSERPAAYSDLVLVDEETLGVLYETGDAGPYESIKLRRLPLGELDES